MGRLFRISTPIMRKAGSVILGGHVPSAAQEEDSLASRCPQISPQDCRWGPGWGLQIVLSSHHPAQSSPSRKETSVPSEDLHSYSTRPLPSLETPALPPPPTGSLP